MTILDNPMSLPLSPVTLRRIFLLLIREHYSNPEQYGDYKELLQGYKYSDTEPQRTIDIDLMHTYDPEKLKSEPSIYVGFQPFAFAKRTVSNYAGHNEDESVKYYTMPTSGILLVRHVSTSGDNALMLGELTTNLLFGLHELLLRKLPGLLGFDIASLSDPRLISKAPQRQVMVDLACKIDFNYALSVNEESHRLKKIVFVYETDDGTTVE